MKLQKQIAAVLSAALIWSGSPQVTWASPNDPAFEGLLERVGFDSEKDDASGAIEAVQSYVRQETYRIDENDKLNVLFQYLKASIDYCNRPIHSEKSFMACYEAVRQISMNLDERPIAMADVADIDGSRDATWATLVGLALFLVVVLGLRVWSLQDVLMKTKLGVSKSRAKDSAETLIKSGTMNLNSADSEVQKIIAQSRRRYMGESMVTKQWGKNNSLQYQDLLAMTDDEIRTVVFRLGMTGLHKGKLTPALDEAVHTLLSLPFGERIALAKSSISSGSKATAAQFLLAPIAAASAINALQQDNELSDQELAELRNVVASALHGDLAQQHIEAYRLSHGFLETFTPKEEMK